MTKTSFHYVIKVNGKTVWKGLNPKKKYLELQKKYRRLAVSLVWVLPVLTLPPISNRHSQMSGSAVAMTLNSTPL